jgi:acetylornithine deacetylase/succinyl-diaminopimelate desuccinylase-like protein
MNATLRTTCVATMLKAGEALNALPATAAADVNCRILPGHSPEEVRGDLERIVADNKVKVSYVTNGEGRTATAPDSKGNPPPPPLPAVFAPLETITHGLFPGVPIVPEMETGASDSIYTTADGIPSYGISGFAIDGDDIRFHARDERLRVESYYAGVEFYRLYIEGLGQEH